LAIEEHPVYALIARRVTDSCAAAEQKVQLREIPPGLHQSIYAILQPEA
jgi:hypothetical protein